MVGITEVSGALSSSKVAYDGDASDDLSDY